MTKAPRRKGTLHSTCLTDDALTLVDEAVIPPPDPAVLAAELLILRALGLKNLADAPAGQDGAVTVIIVPSLAWVKPVAKAWKGSVRPNQRYSDGFHGSDWYNGGGWVCFLADEQRGSSSMERAADSFASGIAKGLHCLGIAPDPTWLPEDMVVTADHTLRLPPLSRADLLGLARRLCGGRAARVVTEDMATCLTPRLLRLARRPGQSADDYLSKLSALLGRDRATTGSTQPRLKPSGPRDTPTLDRLHGMNEAVTWGQNCARDLADYQAGTLSWSDVDGGCLLSGPPGCGKTLFARALAASCAVPLVSGSYGQWLGSGSGHQGDLLKSMRKTFAEARAKAPSILFIDEIDSFPDRGTVTHSHADWEIQVVNALLAEIDGVEGREGVVLVGACNHPDKLDPALVRSGRLDRHIRIHLPDHAALAAILREHLGADGEGWDFSQAALLATGSSGADCEHHVRGARRRARQVGRPVMLADLEAELDGMSQSVDDAWLTAVHEAGHAVAAALLMPGSVTAVSLRGTAEQGGSMQTQPASDYPTAGDLLDRIVVDLAGRAAEEVILGVASAGAGGSARSDLARATVLAATSVAALGFEPDFGLAWRGMPDTGSLKGMMAVPAVEASVSRMLRRAYDEAVELLRPQKEAVKALATELVRCRALDGAAVERVLARSLVREDAKPSFVDEGVG